MDVFSRTDNHKQFEVLNQSKSLQMLNSEQNVKECDAIGLIVVIQPGAKYYLTFSIDLTC